MSLSATYWVGVSGVSLQSRHKKHPLVASTQPLIGSSRDKGFAHLLVRRSLPNDGEVGRLSRADKPLDLPTRVVQERLHFFWRHQQIVKPLADHLAEPHPQPDLPRHSAAFLVQSMVLEVVGVCRQVGVTRPGNDPGILRGNPGKFLEIRLVPAALPNRPKLLPSIRMVSKEPGLNLPISAIDRQGPSSRLATCRPSPPPASYRCR